MTTKKFRKISKLLLYLALVAVLIVVVGAPNMNEIFIYIFVGLFGALFCASLAISLIFWRCPNCDKGFPLQHTSFDKLDKCPFCGGKIE